jgi:hypothetical protein
MSIASEVGAPRLGVQLDNTCCELQVSLKLDGLPDLPSNAPWLLNLSAVIEEASGRKSYWALTHPSGEPDFHHSDCFVLEVPAA